MDTTELLAELGAATLGESGGVPMGPRIKPAWPGAELAGPAFTVQCAPGDNLAIHVGVVQAPPGSVLVVDASAIADRGYWGEVLATAARARGLAGLVIDGGVRDVAALEALRFPVFSATVALRGASKDGPGAIAVPVQVGGADVRPGDWVVGDRDGVTVAPAQQLDAVLDAAQARAAKEQGLFDALRAGATTVQLLGLDAGRIERGQ